MFTFFSFFHFQANVEHQNKSKTNYITAAQIPLEFKVHQGCVFSPSLSNCTPITAIPDKERTL